MRDALTSTRAPAQAAERSDAPALRRLSAQAHALHLLLDVDAAGQGQVRKGSQPVVLQVCAGAREPGRPADAPSAGEAKSGANRLQQPCSSRERGRDTEIETEGREGGKRGSGGCGSGAMETKFAAAGGGGEEGYSVSASDVSE
eukprot:6180543-Pleurochrysis_carterae.AAC.2